METYGSMEKKERVEFILEQMRLCLAVKDYIRTQIISKKINTKFFQEENTEVSISLNYKFTIGVFGGKNHKPQFILSTFFFPEIKVEIL